MPLSASIVVRSTARLLLLGVVGLGMLSSSSPARAVILPDLHINKDVLENPPYFAGQYVHYTLFVTNLGADMSPNSNVLVTDRLPAGFVFASATEGARAKQPHFLGVKCSPPTLPDVSCEGPPLVAGDHFIVLVEGYLPARLPGGGLITNQAWVDPRNTVAESNEHNNRDRFTIQAQ
jgi:uncharacterized repeat protein (TIGR01451 family)